MSETAYFIHNNGFDTILIVTRGEEPDDVLVVQQTVEGGRQIADFLLTGDEQDFGNWSGDPGTLTWERPSEPEAYGEVVATNDGQKVSILDERLWEERSAFYRLGKVA